MGPRSTSLGGHVCKFGFGFAGVGVEGGMGVRIHKEETDSTHTRSRTSQTVMCRLIRPISHLARNGMIGIGILGVEERGRVIRRRTDSD
jgi:hypothetical protein